MSTLILDADDKSIEVVMSGAANATNPDFTSSYADSTATTFTEGSNDGALNGTTPVTLVAAPSASTQRVVKSISIQNKDDAVVTLTISYNNNTTLRQIAVVSLAVGDTWTLGGTYTNSGALKQSNELISYLQNVVEDATPQLGGNLDTNGSDIILAETDSIVLDPEGSADGKFTGITFIGTAGETVAFGDIVYLKAADSEWYLAKADAASTAGIVAVAICVSAGTNGNPVTLMTHGIVRADAGFPALTIGAPVYISETGTTTNTVTVTAPTTADAVVRVVGFALTANEMMVTISPDHITVTG